MKHLKKVLIGLAAGITFGVATGITPFGQDIIGAKTADAANLPGLGAPSYSRKKNGGRYNAYVKIIQRQLTYGNYYRGTGGSNYCPSQDGYFGLGTHRAVVHYQQTHGLYPDGSVGPETWGKLRKEFAHSGLR